MSDADDDLIRHYTFNEANLSLIRQRRVDANRLGVAVQLCLLRFPGQGLLTTTEVPELLLQRFQASGKAINDKVRISKAHLPYCNENNF